MMPVKIESMLEMKLLIAESSDIMVREGLANLEMQGLFFVLRGDGPIAHYHLCYYAAGAKHNVTGHVYLFCISPEPGRLRTSELLSRKLHHQRARSI